MKNIQKQSEGRSKEVINALPKKSKKCGEKKEEKKEKRKTKKEKKKKKVLKKNKPFIVTHWHASLNWHVFFSLRPLFFF